MENQQERRTSERRTAPAESLAALLEQYRAGDRGLPSYDELRALAEADAAARAAPGVPAGWKLVPTEPTPEMVGAPNTIIQAYGAKLIYQRMIEAAPSAPAGISQQAGGAVPSDDSTGDAIAKSKRILALVDDFVDRPTRDNRTTLRVALMDEFEAATQYKSNFEANTKVNPALAVPVQADRGEITDEQVANFCARIRPDHFADETGECDYLRYDGAIVRKVLAGLAAPAAPLPVGPSGWRNDLLAIDLAMQHMGDTLNNIDAVDGDDEQLAAPGFDAIKRLLAASASGWVLVPVVPTPKMVDATFNDRIENESHNKRNKRIYSAMLAATPVAPPTSPSEVQDTMTLTGHQIKAALDLISPVGPDGAHDPDELDNDLTFGMRNHRDDDGKVGFGMCCWNDDTDGVLPLDEFPALPGSTPDAAQGGA